MQQLNNSGVHIEPPDLLSSAPISGWEALTEANIGELCAKLPCVTSGMVYLYLAKETCQDNGRSTFRALARGYTHWASGHINTILVNLQHPINCHIESIMRQYSSYRVWIMLGEGYTCYVQLVGVLQGKFQHSNMYTHKHTLLLLPTYIWACCVSVYVNPLQIFLQIVS